MKKRYLFLVCLVLSVILSGCGNGQYKQAINEGKTYLDNKEYTKAYENFQKALAKKDTKEVEVLLGQAKKMIDIDKALASKDYGLALKLCDEIIGTKETVDAIRMDAEKIKQKAEDEQKILELKKTYSKKLVQVQSQMDESKWQDSLNELNKIISETNSTPVLADENAKAKTMYATANSKLEEQKAIEEKKRIEEKKKLEEKKAKEASKAFTKELAREYAFRYFNYNKVDYDFEVRELETVKGKKYYGIRVYYLYNRDMGGGVNGPTYYVGENGIVYDDDGGLLYGDMTPAQR